MRILSLIVAAVYVVFRLVLAQPKSLKAALGLGLLFCASVVFPLICIWFGDELGDYVGIFPEPGIDKRTPGGLVKAGGWVLLILPFIVWWFVFSV
jgi:hypothetical protein